MIVAALGVLALILFLGFVWMHAAFSSFNQDLGNLLSRQDEVRTHFAELDGKIDSIMKRLKTIEDEIP